MESIYYVYIYLDSRKPGIYYYNNLDYTFEYEPFYVGKGKGKQIYHHLKESNWDVKKGNFLKINKIRKIIKSGFKPILFKIKENLIEQEAFNFERLVIQEIGRYDLKLGPLTNLTAGGEGVSGRVFSNLDKEKLSIRMKELYLKRPEIKEKISRRLKNIYKNPNERLKIKLLTKGQINLGYKNGNYKKEIHIIRKCKICEKILPKSNRTFYCKSCSVTGVRNHRYNPEMHKNQYCKKCGKLKKGISKTGMCRSCSQIGKNHPMFGKKVSYERNIKMIMSKRNIDEIDKMTVSIMGISTTLNDDPELNGVALTIFCAKCNFKCKNCQNPESWDRKNGIETTVKDIKNKILSAKKLIKSVVFCGGEFTLYSKQLSELLIWCKEQKLKTILYTGNIYEKINFTIKSFSDIIIDGQYIDELKTNSYPSSSNQKVWINGIETDKKTLEINRRN